MESKKDKRKNQMSVSKYVARLINEFVNAKNKKYNKVQPNV